MKIIRLCTIFAFLGVISLNLSCTKNDGVIIALQNENHKGFLVNFVLHHNYNVEIIDNGNHLKMKNTSMEMWLEILNILRLKLDTISNNIANVNTVQSEEGEPYIRQVFSFTVENGFEITNDESYFEYSNIDIVAETILMIEINTLYQSIANYLSNNYKNLIF